MTTSIKITALNDIGGNISYTTLVPVVDMAGVPTTEKANLQILGNLILSQAGGANFVAANRATTAGTVTTASQPNITIVGTLLYCTISGNLAAGNANLGNLAYANFISGAGNGLSNIQGANVSGQVGFAAVANSVAVANVTGIGNIATINKDGNASNVLLGNGVFSGVPLYPNAIVWTTAPISNTSSGVAGEAAYDAGGNLYVCVSTNTWSKFTGTTSW